MKLLLLSNSLIGTGFFFLYVNHVRSIFETRTNIAHLSQVERESLLRREDALYYSFYKTLTEEHNFWTNLGKLKNHTGIEYPNGVNVLQRFNVLPEVIIGFLYHVVRPYTQFQFLSCWRSSNDARYVLEQRRCDPHGHAMQFYLEFVWLLGGLTLLIIYMYGTLLSQNIFGGIYAAVCYVMFHSYAAKIYDRPMARENFAFPFVFLQMFYVSLCIARINEQRTYSPSAMRALKFALLNAIALLSWQFASIIFATQILIMLTPWNLQEIPSKVASSFTVDYALGMLGGTALAYYWSHGNMALIFAWHFGPALAIFFVSVVRYVKQQGPTSEFSLKTLGFGVLMATSAQSSLLDLLEKAGITNSLDNSYAYYRDLIVTWMLQAKLGFTSSLAACNTQYERLAWLDLWELFLVLIVKPYCVYGMVMLTRFFRNRRKSAERNDRSNDYIERAKKYLLEDFLEENHVSMRDMSNQETEDDLNECLRLLEQCDFDYERYKTEKTKLKKDKPNEHLDFMNDIMELKKQINANKAAAATAAREEEEKKQTTESEESEPKVEPAANASDSNEDTAANTTSTNKSQQPSNATKTNKTNESNGNANNQQQQQQPRLRTKVRQTAQAHVESYDADIFAFQYLYSFLQMIVFTVIGISVKKLFFLSFTQGCVIAPTISSKVCYKQQRNVFWAVSLVVFVFSMFSSGMNNVHEEYFPARSPRISDELDTMLEWIKMNTERDAVFAGPVEIIGTVHLVTKRPIVNHAHLEMRQIIDRTEHVYSVFSRQQSSDIYNQCSQLKIQYLIIALDECDNEITHDCSLLALWDDIQPSYRKYPQFCSELLNKNIPSFLKIYTNKHYGIIKMFSQSVQINLKYNKMPEKIM